MRSVVSGYVKFYTCHVDYMPIQFSRFDYIISILKGSLPDLILKKFTIQRVADKPV